jgi:rubrerythrin
VTDSIRASLQQRAADHFADVAARNAVDRHFCRACGVHRTTSPAVLCPVCADEEGRR